MDSEDMDVQALTFGQFEAFMVVFKGDIDAGFHRVVERLTRVEERLTRVEDRLTGVEVRLTGVEDRLTGVEGEVEGLKGDIRRLDGRVAGLEQQMEEVVFELGAVKRNMATQHHMELLIEELHVNRVNVRKENILPS